MSPYIRQMIGPASVYITCLREYGVNISDDCKQLIEIDITSNKKSSLDW
jgi:hypothetical protein